MDNRIIGAAVATFLVLLWYASTIEDPQIRQYPPIPLAGSDEVANQTYGNGVYLTTSSTEHHSNSFKALGWSRDNYNNQFWNAEPSQGSYADDGTYNGDNDYFANGYSRLVSGSDSPGEWFKVRMPYKIRVTSIELYGHKGGDRYTSTSAKDFKVYGSNDDKNWHQVYNSEGEVLGWGVERPVNSSSYYKYYLFVCNSIRGGNYVKYGWELSWGIFGHEKKYF